MGLCDLPDDVLILIVRQTCADLDRKSGLQLRKKLLLLAVCRRLRSLALPVVYDEVYYLLLIKYDSGYINDTPLHTNLDLVSSVECLHLVQSVSIMLRTGTKPLWDLNSAVQQMRAAGERWDSVRTLRVAMDESFDNPVKLDTAFRSARKIAAALAAMFPRVQQLTFGGLACNSAIDMVGGCIAASYAGQLRKLHGDCVAIIRPGVVFRGLRDASIGYRNLRGTKHLRIGPAELKSLELPDWPGDHSWAAFSADGDESQDIWFPSLQVLDLSHYKKVTTAWIDVATCKGRLHFPALKVLKVKCESGVPHVLERGVFPARMDQVTILATALVLTDISNLALPGARCFKLHAHSSMEHHPSAAAAVKRILDKARDCDEVELSHGERNIHVQPETIASTPLTRLQEWEYVNTDTMVAFIRCLPRLSDLDIRGLIPYHTHPDISVPEPGSDRLVEPISSTLKSMRISFYHDDQKPEPAVLVLKYLLLAVPSLSSISAHRIPSDLMAGFVDVYANQYPHLARLKINIRESRF